MIIGHEKGDDTASRLKHNFGMAKPEGYRKAIRLMQLADRFGLPIVTLWSTLRAHFRASRRRSADRPRRSPARPSNASRFEVPIIAAIVGEGGLGRRGRDRRGQSGADVRACGLFGDLSGGLCLDPLADCRQGGRSGRSDADHRHRPSGPGGDRPRRAGAARRCASRSRPARSTALKAAIVEELIGCAALGPRRATGAAPRQIPRDRLTARGNHRQSSPVQKVGLLRPLVGTNRSLTMRNAILLLTATAVALSPAALGAQSVRSVPQSA